MASLQLAAGLMGGGNLGTALSRGLAGYSQTLSADEERKAKAEERKLREEGARMDMRLKQEQLAKAGRLQAMLDNIWPSPAAAQAQQQAPQPNEYGATAYPVQPPGGAAQQPQARPGGVAGLTPDMLAQLQIAGGPNLTELYKLTRPNWQNVNGNLVDTNATGFKGGFQPGVNISANGQALLSMPDGRGGVSVSAAPGSVEAFRQYQQAQEQARAANTLLPLDYRTPDGRPVGGTVGDYIQRNQAPQQQPAPQAGGFVGNFAGDPQRVLQAIQSIADPQERANALQAWRQQYERTAQQPAQAPGRPMLQTPAEAEAQKVLAVKEAERKAGEVDKAGQFKNLNDVLGKAEALLQQGPTGSGIGARVDTGLGFFGMSTKGGDLASELNTLAGWAIQNVPKAPGAQSDAELRDYRIAAGAVGDATLPVSQRLASLARVRDIAATWQARIDGGAAPQATQPTAAPQQAAPTQPAAAKPQGFDHMPAAAQYKGRVLRDTQTGKVLKSDGMTWKEVP
jgi:hypothetical protein